MGPGYFLRVLLRQQQLVYLAKSASLIFSFESALVIRLVRQTTNAETAPSVLQINMSISHAVPRAMWYAGTAASVNSECHSQPTIAVRRLPVTFNADLARCAAATKSRSPHAPSRTTPCAKSNATARKAT